VCVSTLYVLYLNRPDSLTRIVPARVSARVLEFATKSAAHLWRRRAHQDFPRVTGPLYFLVTTPAFLLLFSPQHISLLFSRDSGDAPARCEAIFVFLSSSCFLFFLSLLYSRNQIYFVALRAEHLRETRHDSDISPEAARGRVDH